MFMTGALAGGADPSRMGGGEATAWLHSTGCTSSRRMFHFSALTTPSLKLLAGYRTFITHGYHQLHQEEPDARAVRQAGRPRGDAAAGAHRRRVAPAQDPQDWIRPFAQEGDSRGV